MPSIGPWNDGFSNNVAGQGGFCPTILASGMLGTGGVTISASNNQVCFCKFFLPFQATISKIVIDVTTAQASSHAGIGIYDITGNIKLVDSGAISTAASNTVTTTITTVTLPPGSYILAWTTDNNTVQCTGSAMGNLPRLIGGTGGAAFTGFGTAANASAGGVLPATLGALSTSTSPNIWGVFMSP